MKLNNPENKIKIHSSALLRGNCRNDFALQMSNSHSCRRDRSQTERQDSGDHSGFSAHRGGVFPDDGEHLDHRSEVEVAQKQMVSLLSCGSHQRFHHARTGRIFCQVIFMCNFKNIFLNS